MFAPETKIKKDLTFQDKDTDIKTKIAKDKDFQDEDLKDPEFRDEDVKDKQDVFLMYLLRISLYVHFSLYLFHSTTEDSLLLC